MKKRLWGITLLLAVNVIFLMGCSQPTQETSQAPPTPSAKPAQPSSTAVELDYATASELERLLSRNEDNPEVAIKIANALSKSDDARLEDITLIYEAGNLEQGNPQARQFSKAAFRLCVRMMKREVMGILPFNAANKFVDISLMIDSTSIRRGAQRVLGNDEGANAFETFNFALDTRRNAALGFDDPLEALVLRIPPADVAYLHSEVASFWKNKRKPVVGKTEPTKEIAVVIAPELRKAIRMYLEVPDTQGGNAIVKPGDKAKVEAAHKIAEDYCVLHQNDPWGIYVASYGWAFIYFDVPSELGDIYDRLPTKQAELAKRLVDAKAKGRPGSDELFGTLDDMRHDFSIIEGVSHSK